MANPTPATYKKPLVTTTVFYHDGTDPAVFEDSIDNGDVKRYGTNVKEQLLREETVDSVGYIGEGDPTNIVIPYHAVIYAVVTVAESADQTKPDDAFCIESSEGGGK